MSNLEDVFLKINQEFAPDLFGDLKGFGERKANKGSAVSDTMAKSIGHSSEAKSNLISVEGGLKDMTQSDSSGSQDNSFDDS